MIEVITHPKDSTRAWKTGRIRVFVGGQPDPAWPAPEHSRKGENPELDLAWKRYNREEIRLMREVIDAAIAQDPSLADVFGKLHFSRKAGCSCGCSPGFIAEGRSNVDYWVTQKPDVESEPEDHDVNEYWLTAGVGL